MSGKVAMDEDDPSHQLRILLERISELTQFITPALHDSEKSSSTSSSSSSSSSVCSLESMESLLCPQESAKLHVALAFTLSSLYYIILNSKGGAGTGNHPIKTEISRIRKYVARMNQNNQTQPQEQEQRTTRIDIEAATRLIKRSISHDQKEVDVEKQQSKKQKKQRG
jgi:hypothetical protein